MTSVNGWCSCFLRGSRPPSSKNFATWVSKWVVSRRIVEDSRELQSKTIHPCWCNERVQALTKTEHCILLQISMTPIRSVFIVHFRLPMYFEIITEKKNSVLPWIFKCVWCGNKIIHWEYDTDETVSFDPLEMFFFCSFTNSVYCEWPILIIMTWNFNVLSLEKTSQFCLIQSLKAFLSIVLK